MLVRERRGRILSSVAAGGVSVRDLAGRIGVSESTIRRDLNYLDRLGSLERTYGGAVAAAVTAAGRLDADVTDDGSPEGPFRTGPDPAKEAMAELAAGLVPDRGTVLLDIGTTTRLIARRLRGRRVTVITSSVAVLDELRDDRQVELVIVGGVLRHNYRSLVGPLAQAALRQTSADLLFLSCTGVRASGQVVDDMAVEVPIKHAMIAAAEQLVVLAPAAKFPGTGALRLTSLTDVAALVTTPGAPESTLELCRRSGGRVLVA